MRLCAGLFISRWVLAALGKTDFGLYGVVGGMTEHAAAQRLIRDGVEDEELYKNLIVWQKAMELTKLVYDMARRFPSEERYALADQLRRAKCRARCGKGFAAVSCGVGRYAPSWF